MSLKYIHIIIKSNNKMVKLFLIKVAHRLSFDNLTSSRFLAVHQLIIQTLHKSGNSPSTGLFIFAHKKTNLPSIVLVAATLHSQPSYSYL